MLLNLSNHPSTKWPAEQLAAAQKAFGDIHDMPFPAVPAEADLDDVRLLAEKYYTMVRQIAAEAGNLSVHLMGEMTFTYALAQKLRDAGIPCVASTSERQVIDHGDGRKEAIFRFVRFRPYH